MKRTLSLVVAALALAGCTKTVAIDLQVVEPCDQKNQALNGVSSFVVSTSGTEVDDSVAFSVADGPQPVATGLGDVIVTVQGFAENVSADGAASATPQAVGRTMPLLVAETTQDLRSLVVAGKLDSFGRTTNAAGECTKLTADAPISGRHGHTATFVPVLNQVLIVGGAVWVEGQERLLATAELWDPATGEFTAIELGGARAYHAASAMPDGRVLISGGFGVVSGELTTLQTGLIFDPITLEFTVIRLRQARAHHTSTLLEGAGLIVLAGGCAGVGAADGCTPSAAGPGRARMGRRLRSCS